MLRRRKKAAGGGRVMQGPLVDGVVRGYLYRRGWATNTTRKENTEMSMSREAEVKRNKKASVAVAVRKYADAVMRATQPTRWSFISYQVYLEKEMATHSSILAWTIPWTEEPGGLQSMGSLRVGQD